MKKTIKIFTFVLSLTLLITASVSVQAEEIPRSSAPQNATEESILMTENLISGILDEVSQGLGYLEARSKANNLIYNAVLSGQEGGHYDGSAFSNWPNNWTLVLMRKSYARDNDPANISTSMTTRWFDSGYRSIGGWFYDDGVSTHNQ